MVFASRRLTPCSWTSVGPGDSFSAGTLEMTRPHVVLKCTGLLDQTHEWLWDWITGMEPLFRLPTTKVSIWIFNVVEEGIYKYPSSWPQFTSTGKGLPAEKFPRHGCRWSVPWLSNRFLQSFFSPLGELHHVGLTWVMLRVVKWHHRMEETLLSCS